MSHKHVWWAADHMAKICQSYKQQERGSTAWKAVQFCWQMNPLNPTLSHMCQQIPKTHTDSQGFPSLCFSSGPKCSTDHCNCTFFLFFFLCWSFKCGFLKSRRERQHVTLKKINFLRRATWKSEFCTVHFTSILFITLPPHFSLTVNIIFNVQHPPTEALPRVTRLSCFMKLPKSDSWRSKHAE